MPVGVARAIPRVAEGNRIANDKHNNQSECQVLRSCVALRAQADLAAARRSGLADHQRLRETEGTRSSTTAAIPTGPAWISEHLLICDPV
jgi:hypothetical protein